MPYASNSKLPPAVKKHLSAHAQSVYRKAFNSALHEYGKEANAHRVAWSAVEKAYHKDAKGHWTKGKTKKTASQKMAARTGRAKSKAKTARKMTARKTTGKRTVKRSTRSGKTARARAR